MSLWAVHSLVNMDVKLIESSSQSLGLIFNRSKCELISSSPVPSGLSVSDFCTVAPTDSSLLGAPLLEGPALDGALQKCFSQLSVAESRLSSIAAHDALLLLKSSLGTPKLLHLLRSSPCTGHQALLSIDKLLRSCVCKLTNSALSDSQWLQASLSVKAGGLGVRLTSHLASSAYLAV